MAVLNKPTVNYLLALKTQINGHYDYIDGLDQSFKSSLKQTNQHFHKTPDNQHLTIKMVTKAFVA